MSTTSFDILRNHFQSLSKDEKIEYIANLNPEERLYFFKHPDIFLFDKQIIPDGDWLFCLLRCGRSFGKTTAGGVWVAKKVRAGAKMIGLCGATYDDVAKVMVPAIKSWFLPSELTNKTGYNSGNHTLSFTNGAKIYCYTSDKEIRGPNLEYLWCDEICNWSDGVPDKIKVRFEDITRAVRVGKYPQTIITSTPKSHPFFIDFQEEIDRNNKSYKMIVGTMFDNKTLPQSYIDEQLSKYGNTPRGLQELYGELITEDPAALFKKEWIDDNRITSNNNIMKDNNIDLVYFMQQVKEGKIYIKRVVIGVDPAISNGKTSDETGIIVVAQSFIGECYVLGDYSGRHTPDEWAKIVRSLFRHYKKIYKDTMIVAETNQGGDLVVSNICAADHTLKDSIKQINATKGKILRAEPVAAKYQRNKIHHVGSFKTLERQMTNFTGDIKMFSPDHLDALVHAINELTIIHQYTKRIPNEISGY